MITVTVLVENTARGSRLLGEHGLAWWIEYGRHRVLFDTGQGAALLPNAAALGIDLGQAEAIVLSHGHFDHVGGLEAALAAAPRARLYLHPRATEPKFSGPTGRDPATRRISIAFVEQQRFRTPDRPVIATTEPCEVVPGVWATGEIPRTNSFEDTGGPFHLDAALTRPDPLLDDQALYFTTRAGVVVLLGCAHAGVVNTLARIAALTGRPCPHAVLGGMHLVQAAPERMARTLAALDRSDVRRLVPLHCTGPDAVVAFRNHFGERCEFAATGSTFRFAGGEGAA